MMVDTVQLASAQVTQAPSTVPKEAASPAAGSAATQGIEGKFARLLEALDSGEKFVDRVARQAMAGRDFSPEQLIAIQAGVYRYSHQLEAFSKLVDQAAGTLRRTLELTG